MGFKNDSFTLQEMNVLQKVKDRQVFDQITFDEWSADLTQQNARDQIAEIGKALKEQGLDQVPGSSWKATPIISGTWTGTRPFPRIAQRG